jgi:phage portal protein BeeE
VDPSTLTRQVWNACTAEAIPAVAKAVQVYTAALGQLALDSYRGETKLPRPTVLQKPDPSLRTRANWIAMQVKDWWVHGNAVSLITQRGYAGTPLSTRYFPAHMWWQAGPEETPDGGVDYYLNGKLVNRYDVIHVQRGAADWQPWRGVGVVEQHLEYLDRIAMQSAAEGENLRKGGVPSVAVIMPQEDPTPTEMDEAGEAWDEKFRGPGRRAALLPNGTQVVPLAWSPNDAQMVEARGLSLIDTANMFNLDAYYVNHQGASHNYKSPGPMFTGLLRLSLEFVMNVFEQTWSDSLVPLGQDIRFDRPTLTRDDFGSMVTTLLAATGGKPLMTQEEGRIYAGLPEEPTAGEFPEQPAALAEADPASPPQLQAVPNPADDTAEENAS